MLGVGEASSETDDFSYTRAILSALISAEENGDFTLESKKSSYISLFTRVVILAGMMTYGLLISMSASASTSAEVVGLTNQQRTSNGLTALIEDSRLDVAASNKATDMIVHNYWAHNSPTGVTPWYWITAAGYPYTYAGENLAKGFTTDSDAVTAWMNSTDHRANLLNIHYAHIGCGFAPRMISGIDTTITVCEYGATATARAPLLVLTQPVRSFAPLSTPNVAKYPTVRINPNTVTKTEVFPVNVPPADQAAIEKLKTSKPVSILRQAISIDQIDILIQILSRSRPV